MKVALDLEDVLVETMELFMEELNNFIDERHPKFEGELEKESIGGWKFENVREPFAEIRGWNGDTIDKFMKGDEDGWKGFLPLTGELWKQNPELYRPTDSEVQQIVEDIRNEADRRNGRLDLVTARMNGGSGIERRLEQLGIMQTVNSVVLKREKQELDYSIYVDDHPYLHRRLGDGQRQIMVTQPWNRDQELAEPHVRVDSIREVPEVIRDL